MWCICGAYVVHMWCICGAYVAQAPTSSLTAIDGSAAGSKPEHFIFGSSLERFGAGSVEQYGDSYYEAPSLDSHGRPLGYLPPPSGDPRCRGGFGDTQQQQWHARGRTSAEADETGVDRGGVDEVRESPGAGCRVQGGGPLG